MLEKLSMLCTQRHRLDRNSGAFPAIIKVYGKLTKKKHGDYKREAIADLDCTNPRRDHLAVVIPMKLGGRMHDHNSVLVFLYYCKALRTIIDASAIPLAKAWHLAPNMRRYWRRRSFRQLFKF